MTHGSWGIYGVEIRHQATTGERTTHWEELECFVVICKMCKVARLELLVLNSQKSSISLSPIQTPSTVTPYTWQCYLFVYFTVFLVLSFLTAFPPRCVPRRLWNGENEYAKSWRAWKWSFNILAFLASYVRLLEEDEFNKEKVHMIIRTRIKIMKILSRQLALGARNKHGTHRKKKVPTSHLARPLCVCVRARECNIYTRTSVP
jgi:hypothetical protein